jgi:RNA polymerase sigma-70 factor (ECF subfamily)
MAAVDNAPDETLLRRIASGDRDAMSVLFRRRQQNVYRFVLHLTGSPAAADDVTQEVFIEVIRAAGRFEPGRSSVAAWLCGIARNFVRRRLAADRGETPIENVDDSAMPAVRPDPLGDLTQAERVAALQRAVLTLPLRYREALVLCDLQELSYADAAEALGCAVGTVRSRLHRARTLLTAKMQAEQGSSRTGHSVARISRCIA